MQSDEEIGTISKKVILFDGVCNLCSGSVKFVIGQDNKRKFQFAALQSSVGQVLMKKCGLPTDKLSTLILMDKGRCYTKSEAILKILEEMGGIWTIFRFLKIIPLKPRDWIYDRIVSSRYKIFGKKNACMVPSANIMDRFLDYQNVEDE